MTIETDVAVVGAGAAGLAAARELKAAGVNHVVLEAKPEIGGRTFCDQTTFGFPYDIGGFWLYDDNDNLFIEAARELGFDIDDTAFPWPDMPMILGDVWETSSQLEERLAHNEAAMAALAGFARSGPDRTVAEVIQTDSPWLPVLASWMGMLKGRRIETVSAADSANRPGGFAFRQVREGMGNLICDWADTENVHVNTPVRAIDWSATGVALDTGRETVTAKTAILTASVGVLASDTIHYARPLPARVREALDCLPMGTVNRIAVQFDGDVFGEACPPMFGRFVSPDRYIYVMTRLVGENVALGYVGNDLALALEDQPDDVAVDLLCDALDFAIGHDVRSRIKAVLCTRWHADPWTLGAYAEALPGGSWARRALHEPWDNRVFVAGEATSLTQFSQVQGAANEGMRAARAAIAI